MCFSFVYFQLVSCCYLPLLLVLSEGLKSLRESLWQRLTDGLVFTTSLWKVVCVRTCVCVRVTERLILLLMKKGSKAFRSIIAIIIIMITTILPVYCNIIDALVQVTYLIFLQRTLMKWFIKLSHKSWSFEKVWKLQVQCINCVLMKINTDI